MQNENHVFEIIGIVYCILKVVLERMKRKKYVKYYSILVLVIDKRVSPGLRGYGKHND